MLQWYDAPQPASALAPQLLRLSGWLADVLLTVRSSNPRSTSSSPCPPPRQLRNVQNAPKLSNKVPTGAGFLTVM